jgi:hypothetical protein
MRLKSHLDTLAKLSVTVMCITSGLALQWSCSTANEAGRCTSYEAPKYVAAMSDTDGKPWEIIVAPKVADFTCDNKGDKGTLRFSAVVLDGQKQAKPAVAIQAVFSGLGDESKRDTSPGIYSNPANGDDTKLPQTPVVLRLLSSNTIAPSHSRALGDPFSCSRARSSANP